MGYLSKPLGKSNFYATGFMSAVEISASNGSAVESYANNLVSINVPATFITSDNRSFNLQTGTGAVAEPVLWHNNFNPTFGLDGTPVTGVTSNNPIIQRHNVLGSVPWQMTPFARSRVITALISLLIGGIITFCLSRVRPQRMLTDSLQEVSG